MVTRSTTALASTTARLGVPRTLGQVLFGAVVSLVAALARIVLTPIVGAGLTWITFYPAVAIAAWRGGLVGGLAAVVASAVLGWTLVPALSLGPLREPVSLLIFLVAGALVAALGGEHHRSRAAVEAARRRAELLADASGVLHERLEPFATIEALTHVTVPRFADWCAIDLFDAAGRFEGARVAAPDAAKVHLAHELRRRYPYQPDAPAGVAAVARTGVPEFVLDMPPDFMDIIPDPELRELMTSLRFRSYISVPLTLPDGRILGVLSVVMSESGRRFEADDVQLAAELGRRAAVALDHARLHAEVGARRDELDAVIAALDDAVVVTDADQRVRSQNPAATRLFGDAVARPLDELLARLRPVPGRPDTSEVGDTHRYVAPLVVDASSADRVSRIVVLRDVTDVLDSEAARDQFVSMLSHELRTPITTILGAAHVLRRPLEETTRAGLIDDLVEDTDRLHRLVEDLLVLSRFERGRLESAEEPVLVQRIASRLLAGAAAAHPRLRVTLEAPPDTPAVVADATYVEQILRNLLSNSLKYAGTDAAITIRIVRRGDRVEVVFEDDGPGIPEAQTERVFGLYERLGSTPGISGAGIGLFVCRRLVETMGGEMRVERAATGGARFTFALPAFVEDLLAGAAEEVSFRPTR